MVFCYEPYTRSLCREASHPSHIADQDARLGELDACRRGGQPGYRKVRRDAGPYAEPRAAANALDVEEIANYRLALSEA